MKFKWVAVVLAVFAIGFAVAIIALDLSGNEAATKTMVGGPFTLRDMNGKTVTDNEYRGKLMLVMFGYTHCPDVCPTELQTISTVLSKLGNKASRLAPIFVSVDPDRDSPDSLTQYLKSFDPLIIGLTGNKDQIAQTVKDYRAYFRKADTTDKENYVVDHTAYIYLMDVNGVYLTHFTFETSAENMVKTIEKYL